MGKTDVETLVNIRQLLADEVEKSVVGPYFGEEELLPKMINPTGTYWSGVLYPKELPVDTEDNDDSLSTSKEEGEGDDKSIPNIGLKPSSFGLTCYVKPDCKELKLDLSYGLYSKIEDPKSKHKSYRYGRQPISKTVLIQMVDGDESQIPLNDEKSLVLKYYVRKRNDVFVLTVFMLNEFVAKQDDRKELYRKCFFQPKIRLTSKDNGRVFVDASNHFGKSDPEDEDSMELNLLFSSKKNFAGGHGCAVEWDEEDSSDSRNWLETTFVPKYEVPIIEPEEMDLEGLYMKNLYDVKDYSEYVDLLNPIANAYEKWIQNLDDQMSDVPKGFEETAKRQKEKCENALFRIRKGIKLVSEDKIAGEAFAFANHAMYLQRAYGTWAGENIKNDGKVDGLMPKSEHFKDITWRLFQLAFVLLNIESIIDPKSDERKIADLLWFPTGGGKTEAYLGLIAFTLAHRRLRYGEDEDPRKYGVTVIMRYTLRLLTLQQFQRAVLLMCACESIRRKELLPKTHEPKWGTEPFSVGLWVGTSTTPNSHDGENGSLEAIYKVRDGKAPKENNPVQLLSCPWCGAKLSGWDYHVPDKKDDGIRQCRISCSNDKCSFSSRKQDMGIPALVVDDDIYSRCPSMIIGTVDKFARISWKEETGLLFGRADRYCPKHGFVITDFMDSGCNHRGKLESWPLPDGKLEPPELIVQDELHLISGPLGTLTGLYETAIDTLCTNDDGIPPKIIASTATTKKSKEQILGLFNRENSEIFPPQGFKFGDSFFAKEIPLKDKRGKMYLGVCSTSRSGITVQAKIAASLLRKVRYLQENLDSEKLKPSDLNEFFTLTAYFNSMKELGNASKMYLDSVPGFINTVYRKFELDEDDDEDGDEDGKKSKETPKKDYRSTELNIKELTSRKRADEIPQILKELDVPVTSESSKPADVLLCTNMLSVGIDISRLGVMIINGQPKNHAEYIQASGRVGRGFPGLIITNYSFLKPRDLSHYENFNRYHSSFHMNVEPVSLTPFSSRARDRALFGITVALIRLFEKRLAKNSDAQFFNPETEKWIENRVDVIREQIKKRIENIDKIELDGTLKDFDAHIRNWKQSLDPARPLFYSENKHPKGKILENRSYLMKSDYDGKSFPIFVPNSLRDAESTVNLFYFDEESKSLKERESDE